MKAKILVTGATGNVGREIANKLSSEGVFFRAGIHSMNKAQSLENEYTETVHLDYEKPETINNALEGIETMILITPPHYKQVEWAVLMIDKAKEMGVKRVIRLSVIAAAMEPGILLGRWHRTVERYLQASGMDWTIIRPGPFMQNFLGMYMPKSGAYQLPISNSLVNHIDARDVAKIAVKVIVDANHSCKIYMVTGGEAMNFNEAAEIITDEIQEKISYQDVTKEVASEAMIEAGRPEWLVNVLGELFTAFKMGAVSGKFDTYRELTNEEPRTFEEFVKDNKERFKAI